MKDPSALPAEKDIIPDYHGPQDVLNPGYEPHKRVWDVTGDLMNGRVTNSEARAGLRKALDKADAVKPHEGEALGRAIKGP